MKIKVHRNIILPVVLYECATWSPTLREESRLSVFENRVLRRLFGPKRDEVTREWRKLHKAKLNDLFSSPYIAWVIKSRRMWWAGNVADIGRGEVYTGFWCGNSREGDNLEDPDLNEKEILSSIFRMLNMGKYTGSIWLRIWTGRAHL
jgi:hypothetical protein